MTGSEIINLIKGFSLSEKLRLVEEILRNIREENISIREQIETKEKKDKPAILSFAGILNEEEAAIFDSAVEESRKIDENEW
jgi:hypothetical protein